MEYQTQLINREDAPELVAMYRRRGIPIDVNYTEDQAVIVIHQTTIPTRHTPWPLRRKYPFNQ